MRLDELDRGRFHHFNIPYAVLIDTEGLLSIFTSICRKTVENGLEGTNVGKSNSEATSCFRDRTIAD